MDVYWIEVYNSERAEDSCKLPEVVTDLVIHVIHKNCYSILIYLHT
jgi:hypothetical protein